MDPSDSLRTLKYSGKCSIIKYKMRITSTSPETPNIHVLKVWMSWKGTYGQFSLLNSPVLKMHIVQTTLETEGGCDSTAVRAIRSMHLTSLQLVGVSRHGRVTQWKSRLRKFHLECKLQFPSAQLMLRQTYLKVARLSTEFLATLTFNRREYELRKLPLNSSLCAVTPDSKSRWTHCKKLKKAISAVLSNPSFGEWGSIIWCVNQEVIGFWYAVRVTIHNTHV